MRSHLCWYKMSRQGGTPHFICWRGQSLMLPNIMFVCSRFFKLKEVLVPLLANEEWSKKINFSLTMGDWNTMGKVVKVLQVTSEQARAFYQCYNYLPIKICTKSTIDWIIKIIIVLVSSNLYEYIFFLFGPKCLIQQVIFIMYNFT